MRSIKALELINNGRIEELKAALQDEIYQEQLAATPDAKKRYAAMKKYFTYTNHDGEYAQKPCIVKFEGDNYISFCNTWSLALTKEDCGEIELFDNAEGKYPDVCKLPRFDGIKKKIDFNRVIAEAKSLGYKLSKNEVGPRFKFLMLYDGTYYKIGLIDATYSIIDDGEIPMVYHPDGKKQPLTIQTSIGICMIMPVYMHSGEPDESHIIIKAII